MADSFFIKQGDTSPAFEYTPSLEDGQSLTAATARLIMVPRGGGASVVDAACAVDAVAGTATYAWSAGDTAAAGFFRAEIEITYADGSVETFPNSDQFRINIQADLA